VGVSKKLSGRPSVKYNRTQSRGDAKVSDTPNPNKLLHRNFHELCVWIPSMCNHLDVLEEINKKKRGLSPDDLKKRTEASEAIMTGLQQLKEIVPPLFDFEVVRKHSQEFNEIVKLQNDCEQFWAAQEVTEARVCANKINTILVRVRPHIWNSLVDQMPPRVTTLQAGLELLGGKTKVVAEKLQTYLDIHRKKVQGLPLTRADWEKLDACNDEVPHELSRVQQALSVYRKASGDHWPVEAQQLINLMAASHANFTEEWADHNLWSEADCQRALLAFQNFQMAVSSFITLTHEWR
jgi:hypothetical protein